MYIQWESGNMTKYFISVRLACPVPIILSKQMRYHIYTCVYLESFYRRSIVVQQTKACIYVSQHILKYFIFRLFIYLFIYLLLFSKNTLASFNQQNVVVYVQWTRENIEKVKKKRESWHVPGSFWRKQFYGIYMKSYFRPFR